MTVKYTVPIILKALGKNISSDFLGIFLLKSCVWGLIIPIASTVGQKIVYFEKQ